MYTVARPYSQELIDRCDVAMRLSKANFTDSYKQLNKMHVVALLHQAVGIKSAIPQ